jgi:competence protein ComEC
MGAFGSTGRRLSELRPLAARWRLPALAGGLLVGEVVAAAGGREGRILVLALAFLAPAIARRRRGLGLAYLLAAGGVVVGLAMGGRAPVAARGQREEGAQRIEGVVEESREFEGFGGRRAASLLVRVDRVVAGVDPVVVGDLVRLRVWQISRAWEPGRRIGVRIESRRPRGPCNGGRDRFLEASSRDGISWVADVGDDRSIAAMGDASGWWTAIARLRRRIATAIDDASSPRAAPVLRSIVVGDASGLAPDLREAYARTGTSHVLSVSGLHVAIVAATAMRVIGAVLATSLRLAGLCAPLRVAAVLGLLPATAYVLLAGAAIPALRSLAACAAMLVGLASRRRADPWVAMAAGATWIGIADPEACLDASFQLSFGAVLAIASGSRAIDRSRLGRWTSSGARSGLPARAFSVVLSAVAVSLCAAVGTAPITAAHFGMVSAAGCLANLLVVPIVGWAALVAGLVGALLLPSLPGLAGLAFAAASHAVGLAEAIVLVVAGLPGASFAVFPPSPIEASGWTALLAALVVSPGHPRRTFLAIGVAAILVSRVVASIDARGPELRIAFLDVGQGDATVVEIAGRVWLVDGGEGGSGALPLLGTVPRALVDRRVAMLEAVALTHPQHDHEGGLAAVASLFPVGEIWSTGASSEGRAHEALLEVSRQRGIPWRVVSRGARVGVEGPQILGPPAEPTPTARNDDSLVSRWSRGATSLLLPGDVESAGERRLLADGLAGAVLLRAPHHGSRSSSGERLADALRPSIVVAGTGFRNRFGLPAPEVVGRWQSRGAWWLDTAEDGEVVVEGDGQLVTVATCRPASAVASRQSDSPRDLAAAPPGDGSAGVGSSRTRWPLGRSAKRKETS